MSADEQASRCCRICMDDSLPLLQGACGCKNTIAFVHKSCLENWLHHHNKANQAETGEQPPRPPSFQFCDICQTPYSFAISTVEVNVGFWRALSEKFNTVWENDGNPFKHIRLTDPLVLLYCLIGSLTAFSVFLIVPRSWWLFASLVADVVRVWLITNPWDLAGKSLITTMQQGADHADTKAALLGCLCMVMCGILVGIPFVLNNIAFPCLLFTWNWLWADLLWWVCSQIHGAASMLGPLELRSFVISQYNEFIEQWVFQKRTKLQPVWQGGFGLAVTTKHNPEDGSSFVQVTGVLDGSLAHLIGLCPGDVLPGFSSADQIATTKHRAGDVWRVLREGQDFEVQLPAIRN
eukprot:TRINITY_DN15192_c0_g1_i1.p1 TRINITY_DN15192_c0_g1~~TRINITY_DN15192_c0_g1_i1.p1  ORF type:complete len:350 (-),score=11.45 TRINITY_DN15192_c0_g1_i1:201-1250(-)